MMFAFSFADGRLYVAPVKKSATRIAPSSFAQVPLAEIRPAGLVERSDCTVRALVTATGMPYVEAHALLAKHGRTAGRGMPWAPLLAAYREAGLTGARPDGSTSFSLPARTGRVSVARWLRAHPRGRFIVHHVGHVFAVVDGVAHDSAPARAGALVDYVWTVPSL